MANAFGCGVMGQRARQVWRFLLGITEWIVNRIVFQAILRQGGLRMLKLHVALKAKLRGGAVEFSNCDGVIKRIVEPVQTNWIRDDAEAGVKKLQVVARPRAKHHSVFAEPYRLAVT